MTLHSIGQATPAWLTQVLCAHGLLAGAEILEVRRRPCNQLATSGAVYRLEVVYSIPCQASDSLILKLPAFEEVHRRFYFERGFYAREVLFYREFSQRTPDKVPRALDVGWSEPDRAYHLLIEDSRLGREQPAWSLGPSFEHVEQAVDWLASFQATWWNHPDLITWGNTLAPLQQLEEVDQTLAEIDALWQMAGNRFGSEARGLCRKVAQRWEWLLEAQADSPRTLCHGDFHVLNMFVPLSPTLSSVHVVDWQFCHVGVGVSDLADYLGLFVHPQARRVWEKSLLKRYWQRLKEYGVSAYSFEQCMRDYRIELTKNLLAPLFQRRLPQLPFDGVVNCLRNALLALEDSGEIC